MWVSHRKYIKCLNKCKLKRKLGEYHHCFRLYVIVLPFCPVGHLM